MGNEMKINMENVPHKWIKLALTLQNAVHKVYRMKFEDQKAARRAVHAINAAIDNNPTWFRMTVIQRGDMVLIIKEDAVTDVTLMGV